MVRNLLIGLAVAMAVAGAAAIATAQDDKDKGPAAEGKKGPGSSSASDVGHEAKKLRRPRHAPRGLAPSQATTCQKIMAMPTTDTSHASVRNHGMPMI